MKIVKGKTPTVPVEGGEKMAPAIMGAGTLIVIGSLAVGLSKLLRVGPRGLVVAFILAGFGLLTMPAPRSSEKEKK